MGLTRLIGIVMLTTLLILMIPAVASANSMYLGDSGSPIKAQRSSDIALEKQVMQVWLRRGFAEVENVYQFSNGGEAQTFVIGLPEEVNSRTALEYGIYNFRAYIDGSPVEARTAKTNNEKIGSLAGTINWHMHDVFIAKGQRRIVVHRYWIRISPWKNKLVIPLEPAASWKGKIGRAEYIVHLAGSISEKKLTYPSGYGNYTGKYAIQPVGFRAGESQIKWVFTNYEPQKDIEIEIFAKNKKSVHKVAASSAHVEDKKKFIADYAVDEDAITAWGVGGPGKKEWLTASFGKKKWVREFRIIPGYGKLEGMYKYFNRPRDVILRFSDGSSQRFELKDMLEMQYFPVKPVQTKYVKLEIESVYKGIYPDVTYVSEVEFGELGTSPRIDPAGWKPGLEQVELLDKKSKYSTVDLITTVVTAVVFLLIGWQVIVALRKRSRSNRLT
ncbi:MAG TPA: discoidin domain-containing protein [Anaerolineae bacterium]|jgi:hypothetical protein|nr:discoidin domain-containing protein [Anaerolineae bacterium]